MKPFEEQFTAWVDGKLTGKELSDFEQRLAEHPEAAGEKSEALKLRELLREQPAPALTNPDFFNHQLMQRIAAESAPAKARERKSAFLLWIPRVAWAGAFCVLASFAFLRTMVNPPSVVEASAPSDYFAQVVEAWPSDPSISATTVYSAKDNVTVVWLDGLDYIPASDPLQ